MYYLDFLRAYPREYDSMNKAFPAQPSSATAGGAGGAVVASSNMSSVGGAKA